MLHHVSQARQPFDLRKARMNAGLSRLALSKITGVSRDSIRRIEQDTYRHPRASTVKPLADYFTQELGYRVTVVDIIGLEEDAA